ncbi:MAG TPA: DinB family protein [Thermoanaerobaculia bacterium]|nr:DinB family protein [Thermoanaerobaculia bacterium]
MRAFILPLLSLAMALPGLSATVRQQAPAKPQAATARPNGFRSDFLADLDEVQDKINRLAAAMPADKYLWRPAPGVRSVSEVYMHIAGGNYFLLTFIGQQPPSDIPNNLEKVSDKAAVLAELKRSFEHLRKVVANEPDSDLDKTTNMFGKPATHRFVFLTILNHLHEHLGQSIAYARMNGVVPPWSE